MIDYTFNNVNEALPALLRDAMAYGDEVGSRLGERTMELTHVGITLTQPWQRELVLPSRKANVAAQIVETAWVLAGRNDIATLLPYLPRAADFSDDGRTWRAGYGPRLRSYADGTCEGVDQLGYIVDTLRSSPGSRQAVATIWDPRVDNTPGKDRACNNWLHFLARKGKLDLLVGIRSNDAMWGWSGINAFEWSALQEIVAGMIGHQVGKLSFAIGSFHVYDRHWAKARELATQGDGWFEESPRFNATGLDDMESLDYLLAKWFEVERLIREGWPIGMEVEDFPEPMLRSWLRVLQWYWSGDEAYLQPLRHTRLGQAALVGVKPAGAKPPHSHHQQGPAVDINVNHSAAMLEHINKLHAEKHAAYGDSWKRRGEAGILGNIARKVDRIGSGVDTSDETQADTAQDLLVYLAKYRLWLSGFEGNPVEVAELLADLTGTDQPSSLNEDLDQLFAWAGNQDARPNKVQLVNIMLEQAYSYALSLW